MGEKRRKDVPVTVLAPKVMVEGTKEMDKFGLEGVPMVVKPGVKVEVHDVLQHFAPKRAQSRSYQVDRPLREAQPMAVNVYSAFWTLCASVLITIVVSLFTTPKPDSELKNLVMGLTPRPDEGRCPWYKRPMLWAAAVFVAIVLVDIIFW